MGRLCTAADAAELEGSPCSQQLEKSPHGSETQHSQKQEKGHPVVVLVSFSRGHVLTAPRPPLAIGWPLAIAVA
ncbi:unnamed protein product [Rangifer tarandus platyrhynchus]|uniref:Uncharacterized protein n=1 Tax=Rangifer tarandus platyrhynchus TaxID=3082113 RepID=A0AC59YFG6_RANTA